MAYIVGELVAPINVDTKPFEQGLDDTKKKGESWAKDVGQTWTRAGEGLDKFGKQWTTSVTLPILGAGTAIIYTAADFESSMNRVRGLTGATGDEFNKLRDQARELGATTQYSASEAADGMGFLAMAGFKTNEILGAMPSVLELAASAQMDLADAADITSNILTGYGKDVSELGHVNDVLVKAMTSANVDLRMLGESMKYVGPVASGVGVQFEEVAAAVGLLGNAGIQGSMAGTVLRGAISRLANPTKQAADIMERLGINVTDSGGNLKSLSDIIGELEKSGATTADMMALFGDRAGPGMSALVEQGSEALADLTEALEKSEGAAKAVAEVNMEGAKGAFMELKSAGEALAISVAESGLLEYVTDIAKGFAEWLRKLSETNPELLKTMTNIALVAAAAGPLISTTGKITKGIGGSLTLIGKMSSGLKNLRDTTPGATSTLGALGTKLATLGATAGPIVLATAAIGGLAYAVAKSVPDYRELTKEARELDRAMEGAMSTFAASKVEFEETTSKTAAAAELAERYIDRLEELEEKGLDSNETQREYAAIVARLNDLIPDLNAKIDETTGLVEGGTSALRINTQAWKDNAMAQALQDRLARGYSAYTEALLEQAMATAELEELEKELAERRAKNQRLNAEDPRGRKFVDPGIALLETKIEALRESISNSNTTIAAMADELENTENAARTLADTMSKTAAIRELAKVFGLTEQAANDLVSSLGNVEYTAELLALRFGITEEKAKALLDAMGDNASAEDFAEALGISSDTAKALIDVLSEAADKAKAAGEDVGAGFAAGIDSKAEAIESAAKRAAKKAGSGFTVSLQIRSPSRVAMEWGRNVMEGFAIGLEDDTSLGKAIRNITGTLSPDISFAGSASHTVRMVHDVNFSGLPAGIDQTELKHFVLTVLNSPQGMQTLDHVQYQNYANMARPGG